MSRSKDVVHEYIPRDVFVPFHEREQRWAFLVAHRRCGKTVATINDQISRALYYENPSDRSAPQFAYIAPFYSQAKRIAWNYFKQYTRSASSKISESDLIIRLGHNDATISLFGADNPDSFRGLYFDGVVLDEYGMMKPSVWSEVILPTLIDRRGWATFIGTPNGPNHFRDLYYKAKTDPKWFTEILPVSKTQLISEEDLAHLKELMLEEEYLQEMECSFEASTRGAFYAAQIAQCERENRITNLNLSDLPLDFFFDLGYRDDTAIICTQQALDGYPIVHAESANQRPIAYYIERIGHICAHYGLTRGNVYLPHDAKAKSLQTGRSIVEQFMNAGIRPHIVPNLDLLDGISAARHLFPSIYFNHDSTQELIMALKSYRQEYDEDRKVFRPTPLHDWSSHYADVFRYFCIIAQKSKPRKQTIDDQLDRLDGANYAFSLEDLYNERAN